MVLLSEICGTVSREWILHCKDMVILQAVKLTSVKAQLPYEYYSLNICTPDKITYKSENLGMYISSFVSCVTLQCMLKPELV